MVLLDRANMYVFKEFTDPPTLPDRKSNDMGLTTKPTYKLAASYLVYQF